MGARDNDSFLPPRPGTVKKPSQNIQGGSNIKDIPINIYIDGKPISISSRFEAMGVMAQIIQLLLYLENIEEKNGKSEKL